MHLRRNLVPRRLLQRPGLREPDDFDVWHRRGQVRNLHWRQNLPERPVCLPDGVVFVQRCVRR